MLTKFTKTNRGNFNKRIKKRLLQQQQQEQKRKLRKIFKFTIEFLMDIRKN